MVSKILHEIIDERKQGRVTIVYKSFKMCTYGGCF